MKDEISDTDITSTQCIAVLGTGDMGSGVGRALTDSGYRIIIDLSGRSEHSRQLAESAGFEVMPNLAVTLQQADMVLSIIPPTAACDFANRVAEEVLQVEHRPVFVDCNAVSPDTSKVMAEVITQAGMVYLDVGIIGHAPGKNDRNTRFYVSGEHGEVLQQLNIKGVDIISLGADLGRASALKMTYASLTKGTHALRTAVLLVAKLLEVDDVLHQELQYSQSIVYKNMQERIPGIATDAERWAGEMDEIAAAYKSVGFTPQFHEAAGWLFRLLEESPLSKETRNTMDRDRSLEETLTMMLDTFQNRTRD